MKRGMFFASIALAVAAAGCHKKRTLSNFNLHAGQTIQDVEDQMGSPQKDASAWLAYTMDDGSELRLYFKRTGRGDERVLYEADVYRGTGVSLTITKVFQLPPTTQPATEPAAMPTTMPAS